MPHPTRLIDAVKIDNDVKAARRLLKAGVDADTKAGMDRTMLYYAADHGNLEMVELLLAHNANPNHLDEEGFGALHRAMAGGYFDIADRLIAAGADINARDQYAMLGLTPMHIAFNVDLRDERVDRVIYLLEKGADINVADTSGRTVISTAHERAGRYPFALEILTHINEWQANKADAQARAEADKQAAADRAIHEAVHGGLPADTSVPKLNIRRRNNGPSF